MRILRGLMNVDVWLAKRPALLLALMLLLLVDIYYSLTAGTTNRIERPHTMVYSVEDTAGRTLLLNGHDPRFGSGEFDFQHAHAAARVLVSRDFVGVMRFYSRSRLVWVQEDIPEDLKPIAREAAIDEYVGNGGSEVIAAQLRRGDVVRPQVFVWVFPLHLLVLLLAVPVTFSALVRCVVYSWRDAVSRERVRLGLCPKCEYDLRGNTSGVCPECGTKTPGELLR